MRRDSGEAAKGVALSCWRVARRSSLVIGIATARAKMSAYWPWPKRLQRRLWRGCTERFYFSLRRLLVIEGTDFYNPRNTLTAAVVSFTGVHSTQPQDKMVLLSAGEYLKIDLHFEIPRSIE